MSPMVAKEYIPAMIQGATRASQRAGEPNHGHNSNNNNSETFVRYLNVCALDMFGAVLFGGLTEKIMTRQEHEAFCRAAVDGLGQILLLKRDPWQSFLYKFGGITSARRVQTCHQNLDTVDRIARRVIHNFLDRMDRNELDEHEKSCYLYKTATRQVESDVSRDEMVMICILLMTAAVDTTAGKIAWNIVQLFLHPEIQEQVRLQVQSAVQRHGGLTPAALDRDSVPLLHAFVRETHRCTPAIAFNINKEMASSSAEVHGHTFPPGSVFMFDSLTPQFDETFVENPTVFRPERWYPNAVQARKGTAQAVIDHPFFSGPFSQGSRRCPGSRVATREVHVFLARLVLDWEIQGPTIHDGMHWSDIPSVFQTVLVPEFPETFQLVRRGT